MGSRRDLVKGSKWRCGRPECFCFRSGRDRKLGRVATGVQEAYKYEFSASFQPTTHTKHIYNVEECSSEDNTDPATPTNLLPGYPLLDKSRGIMEGFNDVTMVVQEEMTTRHDGDTVCTVSRRSLPGDIRKIGVEDSSRAPTIESTGSVFESGVGHEESNKLRAEDVCERISRNWNPVNRWQNLEDDIRELKQYIDVKSIRTDIRLVEYWILAVQTNTWVLSGDSPGYAVQLCVLAVKPLERKAVYSVGPLIFIVGTTYVMGLLIFVVGTTYVWGYLSRRDGVWDRDAISSKDQNGGAVDLSAFALDRDAIMLGSEKQVVAGNGVIRNCQKFGTGDEPGLWGNANLVWVITILKRENEAGINTVVGYNQVVQVEMTTRHDGYTLMLLIWRWCGELMFKMILNDFKMLISE
ncbi:hypothetical protein L2E82_42162 [Cichorium intybus]|uniref:Uncharacterized protein n=1 Tax=Cichorium intybus TaxID=13427 RepID=A0ACB8ZMR4_CICIN|nr:hypothetical protein L2E82_42162 [Cichorium intybus]